MADIEATVQAEPVQTDPAFEKEQIVNSKRYRESADLVGALLVDGKSYTLKEVDSLIKKFEKKEIKIC